MQDREDCCGETLQPARETRALSRIRADARDLSESDITSFLQLLRSGGSRHAAAHSSHSSFFAKKFCRAICTRSGTNEVNRANILAPGLWGKDESFWLRVTRKRSASALSTLNTQLPTAPVLLPAFTAGSRLRLADGKSCPVTAALLLPSLTGFLAPIPLIKLAKNCATSTGSRLPAQVV